MSLPSILSCDNLGSMEIWAKWQDDFSRPPCTNDFGYFVAAPDPMGIRDLAMPPFSMGNENTAFLYINRKFAGAEGIPISYTWYPDRIERRCTMEGVEIHTITRTPLRQAAALILVSIKNIESTTRDLEIAVKVGGRAIHTIEGWAKARVWVDHLSDPAEVWHYEPSLGAMCFSSLPNAFSVQGSCPKPDSVESKSLIYRIRLKPGETWRLRFVVSLANSEESAAQDFRVLADNFDAVCEEIHREWNSRIAAIFTPGNSFFSGNLPLLLTDDKELERLYYVNAVGAALCTRRDNPISKIGTVYTTLTTDYWPTACFLWDMMVSDSAWAMLDPEVLRSTIEAWIGMDLSAHQSIDYITGKGLGCWYAVNHTALVHLAHTYLRYSGEVQWLNKIVAGKSIIEHLELQARFWRTLDRSGHGLADCGNGWNCGDGLTTWIHETAGFNASWVGALRMVADLREMRCESAIARSLREEAAVLLRNVLRLYAEGGGYWHVKRPDGRMIPTRLLYDFNAVGDSIASDLPPDTKQQMLRFFQHELKTEGWVRGLSPWDDDSVRSYRPDWAWTGCYGAFPAMAVTALRNLGDRGDWVANWLRKMSYANLQGPIGQAHLVESQGAIPGGGPRKSTIGAWTMISIAAFPAMFVEQLFGVNATINQGLQWKGIWGGIEPGTELQNIPFQGKIYQANASGIGGFEQSPAKEA